jgi:CRP/FNR family transcriptional regulator
VVNPIGVTHQEIAAELGSSREVISRILESFAASGAIRPTRGAIEILDGETLNALSAV